ncbi:MAG: hypothetical protein OEZ65_09570 [Gemmatimonadota bacterium]|nr:hypothetical protein [Gemmatimonadota bacterium]MDH5759824.1 hypothetical protein [Gemmatimonadota bacterium]
MYAPSVPNRIRFLLLSLLLLVLGLPTQVAGIPAFARKYKVTCALCHAPFPRLNAFGEEFAGNGFALVRGERPVDTLWVGDDMLRLQRDIPLAIRMDAYIMGLSESGEGGVQSDLQTPWGIKLLSGGQITDDISYYMYFYMSERGELAGLEDAYLQFNDVAGSGVDLIAGQFQVSDPMFKRELRLEYEDYQGYRVRVGDVRADLTYDRGLMAMTSPWTNGDLVVQVVNGRGLSEATSFRTYDQDSWKNVAAHFSQDLGFARLGAFGYAGKEKSEGLESTIRVIGPDLTVPLGPRLELNAQYLYRRDGNPFFLTTCTDAAFRCDTGADDPLATEVDSYLGELVWSPRGAMGRWFFTALYNRVESDRTVFRLRLGEEDGSPGYLDAYETISVGAHYFQARNVRLTAEVAWDRIVERARFTTGVVTAF